jgi:2-keto-4-pentenoate hydratase/2-oxohepta-3-ene-1,7-dioic acid hydratase in catechol pathway
MKIGRFAGDRVGLIRGETVYDITSTVEEMTAAAARTEHGDDLVAVLPLLCARAESELACVAAGSIDDVAFASPVRHPSKILAAPDNYRAHLEEMRASAASGGRQPSTLQKDGLFLKASSSIAGPADGIALRFLDRRTDHEIELVAVIGARCTDVSRENARAFVAGYCLGLDITLRGTEERSIRKSIDGYSLVGPWLVTADELGDPSDVELMLAVNGEIRQRTSTADLLTGVDGLIAYASTFYTLYPGDLVFTGTPAGVGPLRPGDEIVATGSGLGRMRVTVRAHQPERGAVRPTV